MPKPGGSGAICVQRFDDSRNSAIHTTYRALLRSSSLWEPRNPLCSVTLRLSQHPRGLLLHAAQWLLSWLVEVDGPVPPGWESGTITRAGAATPGWAATHASLAPLTHRRPVDEWAGTRERRQRDEGSRHTLAVTLPAYSGERPSGKVTTGWGHRVVPCALHCLPCPAPSSHTRLGDVSEALAGQRNAAQRNTTRQHGPESRWRAAGSGRSSGHRPHAAMPHPPRKGDRERGSIYVCYGSLRRFTYGDLVTTSPSSR